MQSAYRALSRPICWLMAISACAIAAAACLEGVVELVLRYPQAVPALYRPARQVNHLKNYYLGFDRLIVQFRHDCAQYDATLIYRLRPGGCTIQNREHTIEYAVNRAGLRDTDDKLIDPAIIVLGDSQAMGWGVPAEATLAGRLGMLTGRKVLNAAISSYETAREIELLRELVKPSTQYLVIAYCDNDYGDNWDFVRSGMLPHRERANYRQAVAEHERTVPYYPFKHLRTLVPLVWRAALADPPMPAMLERPGFAAMNFLAILDNHRDLLRGRNLIVFEANGFNHNSPAFAASLSHAAARSDLLGDLASMHVIDASSFLTDDDYYLIDDHMRPSGHDKIARAAADIINGGSRWRVERIAATAVANPAGPISGHIDAADRKGPFTVIQGWAARTDTGEPAANVLLLRDGVAVAEAEPVVPRPDVVTAFKKPEARWSGYALALPSDRIAGAHSLAVAGVWPGGEVRPLGNQQILRGN